MKACFLQGYGVCGGGISGEHYISATVLQAMAKEGAVQIGGLPWLPPQQLKQLGIRTLQSNILCRTHNSGLSSLDAVAGTLFRTLDAVDKRPGDLPLNSEVDGLLFERWLLKVLCGLTAAAGFNNGVVPDRWKALLTGADWPEHWGLYVPVPEGQSTLAAEFYFESVIHPQTREVLAAKYRVAGVSFYLIVGRPDAPAASGFRRPRGLIFITPVGERRVEFLWPFESERAITYMRIGSSSERSPQWEGWNE